MGSDEISNYVPAASPMNPSMIFIEEAVERVGILHHEEVPPWHEHGPHAVAL
jgi:hypothetical protein